METTPKKASASDRIQQFMEVLQANQDEIMETGSISAQLWDELFQPDVLGTLQPTAVIARATIASIRQMKDALVAETIVEFFKILSPRKRQKYQRLKNCLTNSRKNALKTTGKYSIFTGWQASTGALRTYTRISRAPG